MVEAARELDDDDLRGWVCEWPAWRRARARRLHVPHTLVERVPWDGDDQAGSPRIATSDLVTTHGDVLVDLAGLARQVRGERTPLPRG